MAKKFILPSERLEQIAQEHFGKNPDAVPAEDMIREAEKRGIFRTIDHLLESFRDQTAAKLIEHVKRIENIRKKRAIKKEVERIHRNRDEPIVQESPAPDPEEESGEEKG
jgi:hypothetical protein